MESKSPLAMWFWVVLEMAIAVHEDSRLGGVVAGVKVSG
jgi:hypothetical protein